MLRFTQERIEREPEKAVSLRYDTINCNGGYQVLNEPDEFRCVQRGSQLSAYPKTSSETEKEAFYGSGEGFF